MSENTTKVLVVDDDPDMRATLADFIAKLGIEVRTATGVQEARNAILNESPHFDLILTDLKLPGGSGLDIVKAAHLRSIETLVTILTGYASLESAIEAIRLGAYDYITKPFTLDEIGIQVRNMVERVSLSKENARLSYRLQDLYAQLNRAQNEDEVIAKLYEEIRDGIEKNARKLDQVLSYLAGAGTPDKKRQLLTEFFNETEKVCHLRDAGIISPEELHERKRLLVGRLAAGLP